MSPWLQEPESLFLSFLIDCFVLCCVVFFPFPTFFCSFLFSLYLSCLLFVGLVGLPLSLSVYLSLSFSLCLCLCVCVSPYLSVCLCQPLSLFLSLSLSSNAQRNAFSFINQFLLIVKESCYHWFSTCIKSETQQLRDMFHFSSSPGFPLVPAGCYSSWVSSSWNRYNVFLLFVVVVVVVVVAILESWRPLKQQQKSFHSRREFVIPDECNPRHG